MRKYMFWAAAGIAVGALSVMVATAAENEGDALDVGDVLRVAVLIAVVFGTVWLSDRQAQIMARLEEIERSRGDADENADYLVAQTIKATLTAVGHDLDRPNATLHQINGSR